MSSAENICSKNICCVCWAFCLLSDMFGVIYTLFSCSSIIYSTSAVICDCVCRFSRLQSHSSAYMTKISRIRPAYPPCLRFIKASVKCHIHLPLTCKLTTQTQTHIHLYTYMLTCWRLGLHGKDLCALRQAGWWWRCLERNALVWSFIQWGMGELCVCVCACVYI